MKNHSEGQRAPGGRPVISAKISLNSNQPLHRLPVPRSDEIVICPLGGVGRIGMNWTLYGHDGKWILVDAGVGFVKDDPGIDILMPDPETLRPILPNLHALIVTHAHEDHIGAIDHLWSKLGRSIPIYASPLASWLIKRRFSESGTNASVKTFRPGDQITLAPFRIATIPVAHSVPEGVALAISTKAGMVVHTGDWKIDPQPVVGHKTSMRAFDQLGSRGVLALVGDSTNADRDDIVPSETQIAENMVHAFRRRPGLIVASCFATNIDRIVGIARAAAANNRYVALAGRSMLKCEEGARAVGIIGRDVRILPDAKDLLQCDRQQAVLICTGTQAEPMSALDRMSADGAKHLPKIGPGDLIVHSARAIPGRDLDVAAMFVALRHKGAEIYEAQDKEGRLLHATGHATRGDIIDLHRALRPKFVIPVHGEQHHLEAHADIARSNGAKDAPLISEGDVIAVSENGIRKLGRLNVRLLGGRRSERGGTEIFPVRAADFRAEPRVRGRHHVDEPRAAMAV